MLFEFEDKNLLVIEEKVRAEERLSFDDGVTLWNSFDLLGIGYLANIVRNRIGMQNNQNLSKEEESLLEEIIIEDFEARGDLD